MSAARAGNHGSPVFLAGTSTVWRKLNGQSRITEADLLAIQKAVETAKPQ
jgi:hypothetical protein